MENNFTKGRGNPWEYDPGPPRNRKWPRLFSETPNYRAIGVRVMNREFFRWHFGPMYYRGRLIDNQVKVLIIGQEGAQDESLTHRSFTGGTGSRLQHLLTHIGITHHYLFLNTFAYPIAGQYGGKKIQWLAQGIESPIRHQRHKLFNYVLERNDVRLVIAVGRAAKESVQTWVHSRDGNCSEESHDLSACDGHALGSKTKLIGVLHPGGAAVQGGLARIKADFKLASTKIEQWAIDDPDWLIADDGAQRQSAASYDYGKVPIPFRDFPFGTNWRLGYRSTTSKRLDKGTSIQLFSKDGKSRPEHDETPIYEGSVDGSEEGYSMDAGDVPYEPPVKYNHDFDRGPKRSFAKLFAGGTPGFPWPDFVALGAKAHPSFGIGPVYRGRTDRPAVIVLADQQGQDDLFTGRALCGEAGQHFQTFLKAMGLVDSYIILRILPIDTLGLAEQVLRNIVEHPNVIAIYKELIRKLVVTTSKPPVLLAMGPHARHLVSLVNGNNLEVVNCKSWNQSNTSVSWNLALDKLKVIDYKKNINAPTFHFDGTRSQIPRQDLPYGTLRWQASSGDRARRALVNNEPSHDYYKITMPKWTAELSPEPLSDEDEAAVNQAPD